MGLRAEKEPHAFLWIPRETLRTLDCVRQALDRSATTKILLIDRIVVLFHHPFPAGYVVDREDEEQQQAGQRSQDKHIVGDGHAHSRHGPNRCRCCQPCGASCAPNNDACA